MLIGSTSSAKAGPTISTFDLYAGAAVVLDFELGVYLINGVHHRPQDLLERTNTIVDNRLVLSWWDQERVITCKSPIISAMPNYGMCVYVDYESVDGYANADEFSGGMVTVVSRPSYYEYWFLWVNDNWANCTATIETSIAQNTYLTRTAVTPLEPTLRDRRFGVIDNHYWTANSVNGITPVVNDTAVQLAPRTVTDVWLGGYVNSGIDCDVRIKRIIFRPSMSQVDLQTMTLLGTTGYIPDRFLSEGFGYAAAEGTGIVSSIGSAAATSQTDASGFANLVPAVGSPTGTGATIAVSQPPARYWRIYITANEGNSYSEINSIELATSNYGANIATGGTASSSGDFGGNAASQAFDASLTTVWTSAGSTLPHWIGYDFGPGNEKQIKSVGIYGAGSGYTMRSPKNFLVQYSVDGSNWTTAWSVSNQPNWGVIEYRLFSEKLTPNGYVGNPWGNHSFWRIDILSSEYASYYSLGELQFRTSPGGQSVTGTPFASSYLNSSYVPGNAFDNSAATQWASSAGHQWLGQQYETPVSISEVAIQARSDTDQTQTPRQFMLRFSDSVDGPYRTVFVKLNEIGWTLSQWRTYTDPAYILPTGLQRSVGVAQATGRGNAVGGDAATAARYWRINITAADGGSYCEVSALELYVDPYGSNIATGGSASSSSNYTGLTPDRAFDSDVSTVWASNGAAPQWLQYDFGAGNAKNINAIGIIGTNAGYTNRTPRDFDILSSNDGTNWTTVWSVTGQTAWGANECRLFVNPAVSISYAGSPYGAHQYWRFAMTQSDDGGYYAIAEIQMRSSPGNVDQTSGGTPTSSTILDANYPASNAFNNNSANFWHSSGYGFQWLVYDFGRQVSVAEVTVQSRPDGWAYQCAKTWVLQFSNSSSGPWRTTMSVSGNGGWSVGETRTYTDPKYDVQTGIVSAVGAASNIDRVINAQGVGLATGLNYRLLETATDVRVLEDGTSKRKLE